MTTVPIEINAAAAKSSAAAKHTPMMQRFLPLWRQLNFCKSYAKTYAKEISTGSGIFKRTETTKPPLRWLFCVWKKTSGAPINAAARP